MAGFSDKKMTGDLGRPNEKITSRFMGVPGKEKKRLMD